MAIGLSDILSTLQNGVTAIQSLKNQLALVFPQATALSTTAPTAGTIVISSQAVAIMSVTTSSGGVYKIPLYS